MQKRDFKTFEALYLRIAEAIKEIPIQTYASSSKATAFVVLLSTKPKLRGFCILCRIEAKKLTTETYLRRNVFDL